MQLKIPQFKNQQDFRNFVENTPEIAIRQMRADDWIELYDNLNAMLKITPKEEQKRHLRRAAMFGIMTAVNPLPEKVQDYIGKLSWVDRKLEYLTQDRQSEFAEKNIKYFAKLYKNFRLEPKYSQRNRKLAQAAAEDFLKSYPQAAEDVIRISIDSNGRLKERFAARLIKCLYQQAYPDDKIAAALRPRVKVKALDEHTAGDYSAMFHSIDLAPQRRAGLATVAHEAFHSGHGVSPLQSLLKAAGRKYTFEDDKMSRLYALNSCYYISGDDLLESGVEKQYLKAYSRQPMEYAADLFALNFEHAARRKVGAEKFNVLLPRRIARVMELYNLKAESYKLVGDDIKCLRVVMPRLAQSEKFLLKEINDKYLLGATTEIEGKPIMFFARCDSNEKRMLAQVKELLEEKKKNDDIAFYKNTIPQTVAVYGFPKPSKKISDYINEVGAKIAKLKNIAVFSPKRSEINKKIKHNQMNNFHNEGR
mgnify:FL=1